MGSYSQWVDKECVRLTDQVSGSSVTVAVLRYGGESGAQFLNKIICLLDNLILIVVHKE